VARVGLLCWGTSYLAEVDGELAQVRLREAEQRAAGGLGGLGRRGGGACPEAERAREGHRSDLLRRGHFLLGSAGAWREATDYPAFLASSTSLVLGFSSCHMGWPGPFFYQHMPGLFCWYYFHFVIIQNELCIFIFQYI
jgi:hypothetical protein